MKAAVVAIAGPRLDPGEAAVLRAHRPAGAILFARNVCDRAQLAALMADLRDALPADAVLLVDQEGGRVARLGPPHWRAHPSAGRIGRLFEGNERAGERAAWLTGALIGLDCRTAGFDVVCAPVLDLRIPGAHDVIGDRAFGADPRLVGRVGRAFAEGMLAAGVQPVIKHIPGHGRARADSHITLPRVEIDDPSDDLAPFAANAHMPWAMTAHILYPAWDPIRPATLSASVIGEVVRGRLGFDGVLLSDDLAMQALSGDPGALGREALTAGCDLVLHCTGVASETEALLAACSDVTERAASRMAAGRTLARLSCLDLDEAALAAERDRLLA